MWTPEYIKFSNLFSHSETTYHFNVGEMGMFLGVNLDDVGADSNGAGKSTIIEAITLAVDGNVYREIGKEDFIKYGEDRCGVEFVLNNSILQEKLLIRRTIYATSKSAKLEIYINDKFPISVPTSTNGGLDVRLGNQKIYEILGVSREDFLNFYVIGQGNNNSFFTSNDTKQKEIIGRFSNFTGIDKLLAELNLKASALEKEILTKNSSVGSCDEMIEFFEGEINDKNKNFAEEKKQQIAEKKLEAKEINLKIEKIAEKAKNNQKTIEEKQSELDKIVIPDSKKIKTKINELKSEMNKLDESIGETNIYRSELSSRTGEFIECPKCEHKFIPDEDLTLEDINESLKQIDDLLKINNDILNKYDKSLKTEKLKLNSISKKMSQKTILGNEIDSFKDILETQNSNLEKCRKDLKKIHGEIIKLSQKSLKDEICEIKSKLEKQEDKKSKLLDSIQVLQDELDEIKFHIFHFGKSGFKTYLANKSIRTIQDICNFYLQKFETNLQVQISGYTILKSGDIRDKIEISVLKNGLNKGVLKKYSGGEQSRINVAGIIAVNRLINNGSGNRGIDLLVFDENISGLDASGCNEIIRILSKSKITTILVMHRIDNIPYKNKLFIKKQNNDSSIISEQEYLEIIK